MFGTAAAAFHGCVGDASVATEADTEANMMFTPMTDASHATTVAALVPLHTLSRRCSIEVGSECQALAAAMFTANQLPIHSIASTISNVPCAQYVGMSAGVPSGCAVQAGANIGSGHRRSLQGGTGLGTVFVQVHVRATSGDQARAHVHALQQCTVEHNGLDDLEACVRRVQRA